MFVLSALKCLVLFLNAKYSVYFCVCCEAAVDWDKLINEKFVIHWRFLMSAGLNGDCNRAEKMQQETVIK